MSCQFCGGNANIHAVSVSDGDTDKDVKICRVCLETIINIIKKIIEGKDISYFKSGW